MELQVKALVWKQNCGTSSRSIFLVWKRNFKATVYSFCGIAELQVTHYSVCGSRTAELQVKVYSAKAELQKFKSKNILSAEAEFVMSCERSALYPHMTFTL